MDMRAYDRCTYSCTVCITCFYAHETSPDSFTRMIRSFLVMTESGIVIFEKSWEKDTDASVRLYDVLLGANVLHSERSGED